MSLSHTIPIVKQTHQLPHYNKQLQLTSNDFSTDTDYIISITIFPLIIFIITFAISIIYFIILSCQKYPKKYIPNTHSKEKYVYTLPLLILINAQIILIGILIMNNGILETSRGLIFLSNQATKASNQLHNITSEMVYIKNEFIQPSCSLYQSNALFQKGEAILTQYTDILNQVANSISRVPSELNKVNSKLITFGITYKDIIFYFCYSLIILFSIILLAALCSRRKVGMKCLISVISMFYVIFLLIISTLQFISLIGIADYCVRPETNTLSLINDETVNQLAYHFMFCMGPLLPLAAIASTSVKIGSIQNNIHSNIRVPTFSEIQNVIIDQVNSSIYSIESNLDIAATCRNSFIQQNKQLASRFSTIKASSINFYNLIQCKSIQEVWLQKIVYGSCNQGFIGYYLIWIGIWVAICTILITIGILCVVLLYKMKASHSILPGQQSSSMYISDVERQEIELTSLRVPTDLIVQSQVPSVSEDIEESKEYKHYEVNNNR